MTLMSNFFAWYIRVLKTFCFFSVKLDKSPAYSICLYIYLVIVFALPKTLEFVPMVASLKTLKDVINIPLYFTADISTNFKIFYLTFYERKVKEILDCIDSDVFLPRNNHQRTIISKSMSNAKRMIGALYGGSISGTTVASLMILVKFPRRDTPLPLWVPFNIFKPAIYEVSHVFFGTLSGLHVLVHVSTDAIPLLLMSYTCAQLDILADTLTNLRVYACEDSSESDAAATIDEAMQKLLTQCVKRHREIQRLVEMLNDTFSGHFFCLLANAVAALSFTMFQFSMDSNINWNFVHRFFFFFCMMYQIFMFTWYGNEILFKSNDIYIAAYSMDWSMCPLSFKKNLLFALAHFQRPLKIYACNFFLLSMESYIAVLRLSWSYFLVFRDRIGDL